MTITVYTKPACVQCSATTRHWTSRALPTTRSTSASMPSARLRDGTGLSASSCGSGRNDHWSGFRPDRIKALAGAAISA